ncbi:MAG TPA: hypothetical protein VGE93_02730, partial [Bryobacteraceae bacterium]
LADIQAGIEMDLGIQRQHDPLLLLALEAGSLNFQGIGADGKEVQTLGSIGAGCDLTGELCFLVNCCDLGARDNRTGCVLDIADDRRRGELCLSDPCDQQEKQQQSAEHLHMYLLKRPGV